MAPAYTLTVSDGTAPGVSQAVNILSFTPLNDRPVFTDNRLTISEGGKAVPLIAISDEDNAPEQLLITVSGLNGGHFELTAAPVGGPTLLGFINVVSDKVESFTYAQWLSGEIRFVHDGSELTPAYTLTGTDTDGASDTSDLSNVVFTQPALTEWLLDPSREPKQDLTWTEPKGYTSGLDLEVPFVPGAELARVTRLRVCKDVLEALCHSAPEKLAAKPMAGRVVRLWRDNDDAGSQYEFDVTKILVALGCAVLCVE